MDGDRRPPRTGRAIFLDRDGVVTEETGAYITTPSALRLTPGAPEAIAKLNRSGWLVFIFTNQAGVGRGFLTLEDLFAIHARLHEEVGKAGGRITGVYFCPHAPEAGCNCRKPKAGLLLQAAEEHGLDLSQCWVVGDSHRDIVAGAAVLAHTALVLTGHTKRSDLAGSPAPRPERVFDDIAAVSDWLSRLE